MAIDTTRFPGSWLEWYVGLFTNRWNEHCGTCWGTFIAACHLGAGLLLGALIF